MRLLCYCALTTLLACSIQPARPATSIPDTRPTIPAISAETEQRQELVPVAAAPVKVDEQRPVNESKAKPDESPLSASDENLLKLCETTRARRGDNAALRASLPVHAREFKEWQSEHCHYEDHAKMVVKTFEDHQGFQYQRKVPDRYADLVCDKTKPPVSPLVGMSPEAQRTLNLDTMLDKQCPRVENMVVGNR